MWLQIWSTNFNCISYKVIESRPNNSWLPLHLVTIAICQLHNWTKIIWYKREIPLHLTIENLALYKKACNFSNKYSEINLVSLILDALLVLLLLFRQWYILARLTIELTKRKNVVFERFNFWMMYSTIEKNHMKSELKRLRWKS